MAHRTGFEPAHLNNYVLIEMQYLLWLLNLDGID